MNVNRRELLIAVFLIIIVGSTQSLLTAASDLPPSADTHIINTGQVSQGSSPPGFIAISTTLVNGSLMYSVQGTNVSIESSSADYVFKQVISNPVVQLIHVTANTLCVMNNELVLRSDLILEGEGATSEILLAPNRPWSQGQWEIASNGRQRQVNERAVIIAAGGSSNITVRNLRIDANGQSQAYHKIHCVLFYEDGVAGTTDTEMYGCQLANANYGANGIDIPFSSYQYIHDNEFIDCPGGAVWVDVASDHIRVEGNNIHGSGKGGIIIWQSDWQSNPRAGDISIKNNHVWNTVGLHRPGDEYVGVGIAIWVGANRVTIDNNTIEDCPGNGIEITVNGNKVVNNKVNRCGQTSISVHDATNSIVQNNIVANSNKGIYLTNSNNNNATYNQIYACTNPISEGTGCSGNTITPNTISPNQPP